jgi:hypothetical protein
MKPDNVVRDRDKKPVLVTFNVDGLEVGFHGPGKIAYRIGTLDNYIPKPTYVDMVRTTYAIFCPRKKKEPKQLELKLKGGSL